jgi:hypothetical protein
MCLSRLIGSGKQLGKSELIGLGCDGTTYYLGNCLSAGTMAIGHAKHAVANQKRILVLAIPETTNGSTAGRGNSERRHCERRKVINKQIAKRAPTHWNSVF